MLFNEIDKYAADWLQALWPDSEVDRRSVADLTERDVRSHDRVHLFAGIGGWEYALSLSGWPKATPVWTGSCPCQPFSTAGSRRGTGDDRHLWPEFYRLVRECLPPIIFGEQVASDLGRSWVSGVRSDLEGLGYAVAVADLCAAGVGAPHIRQRLYWVASRIVAQPQDTIIGVVDSHNKGSSGRIIRRDGSSESFARPPSVGPWANFDILECTDGKFRRIPTEPELYPLAPRVPNGVGRIRAYGNSIVPQVASTFITAAMEAIGIDARARPQVVS